MDQEKVITISQARLRRMVRGAHPTYTAAEVKRVADEIEEKIDRAIDDVLAGIMKKTDQ